MNACWAVKSIRRAEWNGGFRPDSGVSTRDPRRPALRPNEAFKAAVCYVRSTSGPAVGCAQIAVIKGIHFKWLNRP
jgi:hypothetical protein